MAPPPSRIAHHGPYSLFGEAAQLPDVMHCETIAARSALHDWELQPHRHARLHQLLLLESGSGLAQLEGQTVPLAPGTLVNVPPGDVHGFSFAPGTQGYVVTLADEMRDELLAQAAEVHRALSRSGVHRADAALVATLRQIGAEFAGRGPARALVLRGLCTSLLGLAARAASESAPRDAQPAESNLLRRFETLLEAHYLQHWKVADYARALAVTPTHLSRVVRAATGRPASALIDERVLREARRNLAYTGMSVSSIAYTLGFADPAYFSRVFTRACGMSPRAFRTRLAT